MKNFSFVMSVGVAAALATFASGCGTKNCKDGTVFVEVRRGDEAKDANEILVTVEIDGVAAVTDSPVSITPGTGTDGIELDFANYLKGKVVTVKLTARAQGVVVSMGMASKTLAASCERIVIGLGVVIPDEDGGANDDGGGGGDACVPTTTSCPADACGTVDDGCGNTISCASPCFVASVSPRLVETGNTIVLEGTFTDPTTIDLPGAPGLALAGGAHRRTLVVPAAAMPGAMTVHTGNTAVPAGDIRRTTFALRPQNCKGYYAQTERGRLIPSLPTQRREFATIATDDWLYLLGGNENNTPADPQDTTHRFRINADGTLDDPLPGPSMLGARYGHRAVRIGARIYVVGGNTGAAATRSVQFTTINSDGTLSAFTDLPDALVTGRSHPTVHVIGDFLYVIGGRSGTFDLGTLERAQINADGSLGAFAEVAGVTLATPRSAHASFVTSSRLIVVGGTIAGGMTQTATVEIAQIDPDGTLSAFAAGTNLPAASAGIPFTRWGDRLIAFPYSATVASDGTIGTFANAGISFNRFDSGPFAELVVVRDAMYMMGGEDDGPTSEIGHCGLEKDAEIGGFSILTNVALPEGRGESAGAVIGKRFFVFGGYGLAQSPLIYSAPINADDSLGAFVTEGRMLPDPRTQHRVVVAQNFVYVLGGTVAGTVSGSVIRAPIEPDGTIGDFVALSGLSTARRSHVAYVTNGLMCVAGGSTAGGTYPLNVECAQLMSNGNLSAFTQPPTGTVGVFQQLTAGRSAAVPLFFGTSIAIVGGANSTSNPNNSDKKDAFNYTTGQFSSAGTPVFPGGYRSMASGITVGDWIYLMGGNVQTTLRTDILNFAASFVAVPTSDLQVQRQFNIAFRAGNYVYEAAGNYNEAIASVERATVVTP